MQKTFVMIKPDAVSRGLTGEILSRIERKGLIVEEMKKVKLQQEKAGELYAVHEGKPFYNELVEYVTSGPVILTIISGPKAIDIVRKLMGATDSTEAAPGTIRGDFGASIEQNLVHGSDSVKSAEYEMNLFFNNGEWKV